MSDKLDQLNPNPLVSMRDNPFLEAAKAEVGTTQDSLKQSFQVVAGKDPDHVAQVQRMSNQLRIDTGFVERNFETLQKKLEPERINYDQLASENPGVSRFLENSDNAAISKDDLNAISAVEKPVKGYYAKNTSRPFSEYAFDFTGAANRGGNKIAIGALHTLAAYGKIDPVTATGYAKELYAKQKRLEEEKPQYLADLSNKLEQESGDVESAGKLFWRGWDDRARGKTAQGLKDMYFGASIGLYEVLDRAAEYPLNPVATMNLLVENVAQMAPTLLAGGLGAAGGAAVGGAIGNVPGAAIGVVIGQGTGNFIGEVPVELGSSIADDFQKLGIDTADDQQLLAFFSDAKLQKEIRERGLRKGLGTAAVDSLAAAFAGHFSGKARGLGLGSRTVAAAKDVAVGAGGDFLSEGVGQAAREKNFRDVSLNDMIDEVALGLFHNAAETGIAVSTQRSIEAAQNIRERLSKDPVRAGQEAGAKGNEAKATLAEIKDVNEGVEKLGQTKLLDRSPEATKTMVEHIKDSSDGEDDSGTSYFQTSDWDKFWTDNKVDPRDAANLLLNDDGKSYDEAKQTGATFSVDTADLMIGLSLVAKQSAISGDVTMKDVAGNVLKIMRTKPDGMSAIEAAEYLRDLPEVYKQLGGEVVVGEERAAKAEGFLPAAENAGQMPLPIATREEQVTQIRQNISQQLMNTGMDQKEARNQAQLYEGGIRSLSERSGMSPEEIFKRFGPQIQRVSEIKPGEGVGYDQSLAKPFYSQLQNTLDQKIQGKSATTEQVRAVIKNLKPEEIKWSWIEDFLKGKTKIDKAELLDYLRANELQVEEVAKGDVPEPDNEVIKELNAMGLEVFTRTASDGSIVYALSDDEAQYFFYDELPMPESDETKKIIDLWMRLNKTEATSTKFSKYQLPGGENYRELLLRMPPTKDTLEQYALRFGFDLSNESDRARAESGYAKLPSYSDSFKSSHFDETNILAHVRFNDRKDSAGNKVLFLEEIQSDWHQKGRKEGYKEQGQQFTEKELNYKRRRLRDLEGAMNRDQYLDEIAELKSQVGSVPDAPFRKTWHEFALKRMIRYAAENGYEKIAWTTGEQQADRYDLSKQVNKITLVKSGNDNFDIFVHPIEGTSPRQLKTGVKSSELENYIGKDLAKKVDLEKINQEFSGLDLKVGGEGMKGFYDSIVVKSAEKIAKKLDKNAKVTTEQIGAAGEVHTLAITNDIKNAALTKGLELFQTVNITQTPEFKEWFGDSKLVDKSGNPLVFYHGTKAQVGNDFEFKETSSRTANYFFFTEDKSTAEIYGKGKVQAVYLKAENPLDLRPENRKSEANRILRDVWKDWFSDEDGVSFDDFIDRYVDSGNLYNATGNSRLQDSLIGEIFANGYDAVIMVDAGFSGGVSESIVVKNPNQIKSVNNQGSFSSKDNRIFHQTVDEKNAIGRFFIGQDGKTKIQLTPNANKSTFLHETGHFFLEIFGTLVEEGVGDAQFKQDYQTILDWLGVKSKDEITVEHHEKWARGFEKYLGEGLAPSSALQRAFNNFKIWLVDLYKNLNNLNTPLTKEVREVMDRLLATDEEIQQAKGDINFEPIIEDPKIYGFSDTEAALYSNALADAEAFAKQALDQELFQEVRAERKRQVRDEAKRMEKVIESQLNQRQEIIIQSIVGDGVMPDGTALPNEVPAIKITRESVKRLFGEDATQGMKNKYFDSKGQDIEFAAGMLGLETPKELFNILKFGKDKGELVKQLSNLAAYQKFPSLLFSPQLSQKAKDAFYNENRSQLLAQEVAFMRDERVSTYKNVVKKLISKPLNAPEAKARAARILASKTLSDLRPRIYQLAEAKASREAAALFNQNDLDGAIMAKERQLLNHELYRGALEAQKEIEKAEVKFKEIFKDSEDLAKNREMNYVSAARAILAKFELGPEQDLEPVQYLDKIKEYDTDAYNDMISLTNSVLMDIKPADELTYDNFLNLRDNVLAMWDLAKDHKEIETSKGKMLVEDAIDDLSVTMDQKDAPAGLAMTPGEMEGIKQELLSIRAAGTRVEAFVDYMDRNKLGVWNRTIWQPIREATSKWRETKTKSREKFLKIFTEYGSIENNEPIEAPEINFKFRDKWELLTAILHTGNESNQRKLLLGRGWAALDQDGNIQTGNWDRFVKRMRDTGVLGKKEFDFAQKVWDLFEEHLPLIQQAHKKLLGRYFDTVVSKPFSNEFGVYKGGYVPAKYSTLENEAASLRADKKALEDTPNSFMYPDTGRGMTKSRIENYAAPMDLNIKSLPGAIDDSLRFALIQPAIKDVSKIVMNKRFRENIAQQNPKIASEMLVPWLQRSAKQQVTLADGSGLAWKGVDRMARWLRSSASLNIMALSVGNAFQQTTGLFIAAVKVPPRKLLTSMVTYFKNSSGMADFINEKSQFMRTFGGENTIDLQNKIEDLVLNPTQYETTKKFMQKNASILSVLTQGFVNNVAWHAAYEHAVETGHAEADAIALADKAVTRTQGTPFPEDISRIETGTPVMRLFTMFASYFNMMANLQGSEFGATIKQQGLKKGASRLFYVYAMGFMLPAIVSELITKGLSGKGLDEDDDDVYIDDLLSIFFGSQFKTSTMMFPVVGQVAQAAVNRFNDKFYDDNIRSSPVISQLDSALSATYTVPKALLGDGSPKRAVRDALTLFGTITQTPVAPIAKPVGYLIDVSSGDADPTGPIDFTRGLITGKPGR